MRRFTGAAILMALLLASGFPALAEDAGQFTELEGQVTVAKTNGQSALAVLGSKVVQGDVVSTAAGSKATILFDNGSVVRLSPETTLTINKLVYDKDKGVAKSAYDLASGMMMNVVGSLFGGDESEYTINTPTAVSGVRGTINIIRFGINPHTGRPTTLGIGLEGTTWLRGKGGQGEGCVLAPGTWGMVDDETGACQFMGNIPEDELAALLAAFDIRDRSINDRSRGLRGGSGTGGGGWYAPPDFFRGTSGGTGGGDDPEDWFMGRDNPQDFIFQEPPQFTELIINVTIP